MKFLYTPYTSLVCVRKIVHNSIKKFFFLSIIFSSCHRSPNKMAEQERREKISGFFEELLLEHGGAYTLFGSKPVTVEELVEWSEQKTQEFKQYFLAHPEIEYILVDRKLEEGWEEWKKLSDRRLSKDYILTEIEYQSSRSLVFVNVPLTVSTLKKYYADFQEVIGHDFDPIEVVNRLREGENDEWYKMLFDCKTLGILAGYGYQNAALFETQFKTEKAINHPSENNDPRLEAECYLNNKPFRIPIFVMLDKNESSALVSKYKGEREAIKKRYLEKDFLEVTFMQLRQGANSLN